MRQDLCMSDKFSKETRSRIMSTIRSKNTELTVRRNLWATGKRYRIHDKTILGNPDISNKKRKVAIFIDGCFWHGCSTCYVEPSTNPLFWRKKINSNKTRRDLVRTTLKSNGWKVLEFWEHDVNKKSKLITSQISRCL